jgi:lysophospholipase L1-like esterase
MREYRSFAALGDSFTEGVGDLCADGVSCRGWADRFAEHLAGHKPGLRYANLAIRGKLLGEVLDEQVPAAISLGPDLVSLAAGGNDMLRPRTDPDALAVTFETAVAKLTAAGCMVMAFTGFDPKAFPVIRLIRGKAAVFSMHVRVIAAKYDCLLADLWPMRILTDRRLWSPDRLHMASDGHRRVALLACEVAGIPAPEDWRAPLAAQSARPGPASSTRSWLSSRWSDVEWVTEHAAPYLSRRLHGISAGDGMSAKRPELAAFGVPAALAPAPPEPRQSEEDVVLADEDVVLADGSQPEVTAMGERPAIAEPAVIAEPAAKAEPAPV